MKVLESENWEQQSNSQSIRFEKFDNSVRQNQVIEKKVDDQITGALSGAVMTVENRMQDAILTAIDDVVIPRNEMAVKSITGSKGHGKEGEVQNADRTDFCGKIRNTSLMSASSWLSLDNELNRNDETRNDVDFKDGNFPALKPNYDR